MKPVTTYPGGLRSAKCGGIFQAAGSFLDGRAFSNCAVIYRPEIKPVQVVAVLHSKRNIKRILKIRLQ
jgi:hypothetical protein